MTFPNILKKLQLKPRVIHRLPGRLRVHVPALRQISSEFQNIVDVLVMKFSFPAGINHVSINFITGNLLINYNCDFTAESTVLEWLSDLSTLTEQIWKKFKNSANGNSKGIGNNLLVYLKEASKNGKILDKNIIIPDYVWN